MGYGRSLSRKKQEHFPLGCLVSIFLLYNRLMKLVVQSISVRHDEYYAGSQNYALVRGIEVSNKSARLCFRMEVLKNEGP